MTVSESPVELPTILADEIKLDCAEAYSLYDQGDFSTSLRLFYKAWLKLPRPQYQWAEATWILTAIGDTYHAMGKYQHGLEALNSALHCPRGADNPVILLRLAQCHLGLDNRELALPLLSHAYALGGDSVIARHAPECLALLETLNDPLGNSI